MALPPTIPTSFVPKQPVSSVRKAKSGLNILLLISIALVVFAVLAALAAFGYKTYLEGVRDAKAANLAEAERSIDRETVEDFIRLRSRLAVTETLIDQHIVLSRLLDVLEERSLQTVQFKQMTVKVNEDRTAILSVAGVAKSYNSLAAQSATIAEERRIKSAIFSGIGAETSGLVRFTLSAKLDPSLVTSADATAFSAPQETPAAPAQAATTTPAASTTQKTL